MQQKEALALNTIASPSGSTTTIKVGSSESRENLLFNKEAWGSTPQYSFTQIENTNNGYATDNWFVSYDVFDFYHSIGQGPYEYITYDMDFEQSIKRVVTHHRSTNPEQMANFEIFVGNHRDWYLNHKCPGRHHQSTTLSCDLRGRFLSIVKVDAGYLAFCEIEAYNWV
mmetsp:Transcript_13854/g.9995  ORF Transcript_13854/g.9995 Transcript_13854/m.9995 type:complete len:169 (+) Transcript_13854:143-649(+)